MDYNEVIIILEGLFKKSSSQNEAVRGVDSASNLEFSRDFRCSVPSFIQPKAF